MRWAWLWIGYVACTSPVSEEMWSVETDPDCHPMAMADDCFTPFPSLHWTVADDETGTGRRLNYRAETFVSPDGPLPVDPGMFNEADGASPLAPALVNLGVDVHEDFLWGMDEAEDAMSDGAAIALFHVPSGERVPILTEMDQTNRDMEGYDGRWPLIIRPRAPLRFGERYAIVLTHDLEDVDGTSFDSPDAFVALRDEIPTDNDVVEEMRTSYEELFLAAGHAGYGRDNLLLAWDFQVASETYVVGPARSMRDQVQATVEEEGIPYTITEVVVDPNPDVGFLIRGRFTPPNFLDDRYELVREGLGEVVRLDEDPPDYPFTMLVPPQARTQDALPLVLFGHGIFGSGDSYLTTHTTSGPIQAMSHQLGAVIVATDWIGLSDGDLQLIVDEVVPDITRIRLVTDRLGQSIANNLALTELVLDDLQYDDAIERSATGALIDASRVYYYGVSLGGIQGTSLVSVSPRFSRAVLAVPGSGWNVLLQRSTVFSAIEVLIDFRYPDPLSQTAFIAMLQTFFDVSDPGNLGRMLSGDPTLTDVPDRTVVFQEAIGDCLVPNFSTELLVRAVGASHVEEAPDPLWGIPVIEAEEARIGLTQVLMPSRLASFSPADENRIPEEDNEVHSYVPEQSSMLEQVSYLLEHGAVIHPCEGVCDPD